MGHTQRALFVVLLRLNWHGKALGASLGASTLFLLFLLVEEWPLTTLVVLFIPLATLLWFG